MDDSVQVKCTKCKTAFRERAKRLQNDYSRQCPCCEVVLFFVEDSHDTNIKHAMRAARRLRNELRDLEEAAALVPSTSSRLGSRTHASRRSSESRDDD
jgi:hypothetical protein